MTREDAIHIVDVAFNIPLAVRRSGEDRTYHEAEIREAKRMAITALSQEPCKDAISRQAVIDSLHSKFADGFDSDRWWNSMSVLYAINKVPSVSTEKTGRWIPVSERLPEDGEDVLVYAERNAYVDSGKIRKKVIDIGWQVEGRWHIDGCNGVYGIAWMPLPQPYTGESEDCN